MAKKVKKSVVKTPARASKKPAGAKKSTQKRNTGSNKPVIPAKRLINKAIKKIKSRPSRHSDEWAKKQKKKPVAQKEKSSKKLPVLRYKGKKLSPELTAKIMKIRAQARSHGHFLKNSYVIRKYFEVEREILKNKKAEQISDPLKIKGKILAGIDIQRYPHNTVIKALTDIQNDVGPNFTIAVLGFGEPQIEKFNQFSKGIRRVDREINFIYEALDIYKEENNYVPFIFFIPLAWDKSARIAFIDFNETTFEGVDKSEIVDIILELKKSALQDKEYNENIFEAPDSIEILPEEEERIKKERKKKITNKANARKRITGQKVDKKKKAKKKAAKKGNSKKVKSKNQVKKKITYPVNKHGNLDMRYKQNRDLEAKREKARKAYQKRKRAEAKAARERAARYAAAAVKRAATIAKNKRKRKK